MGSLCSSSKTKDDDGVGIANGADKTGASQQVPAYDETEDGGMEMARFSANALDNMNTGSNVYDPRNSSHSYKSHPGVSSSYLSGSNVLDEAAHHMRKGHEKLPQMGQGSRGSSFELSHRAARARKMHSASSSPANSMVSGSSGTISPEAGMGRPRVSAGTH